MTPVYICLVHEFTEENNVLFICIYVFMYYLENNNNNTTLTNINSIRDK